MISHASHISKTLSHDCGQIIPCIEYLLMNRLGSLLLRISYVESTYSLISLYFVFMVDAIFKLHTCIGFRLQWRAPNRIATANAKAAISNGFVQALDRKQLCAWIRFGLRSSGQAFLTPSAACRASKPGHRCILRSKLLRG